MAQFVPSIAKWLGGDKAGDVAQKVVDIAQSVTGHSTGEESLKAIQADPNLAMQFQKAILDSQVQLAQIAANVTQANLEADSKALDVVNKTLQTEAMGGSWLQRNHHAIESMFSVGLVGAVYFILPLTGTAVPQVPESAWIMLGAILGVTSWKRGDANIAVAKKG